MAERMPAKTDKRELQQLTTELPEVPACAHAPIGVRADILNLQRAAGNRAVSQLLQLRGNGHNLRLQRKCATCAESDDLCAECAAGEEEILQRQADGGDNSDALKGVVPIVRSVINGGGQPLDSATREFMISRMSRDFSEVHVHTDMRAAESARSMNALAYTIGRDIVFSNGQYAPDTPTGKKLLAHELAHVLQQTQGGGAIPAGRAALFEAEADQFASRVLSGQPVPNLTPAPVTAQRQEKPSEIPSEEEVITLGPIFYISPFDQAPSLDLIRANLIALGYVDEKALNESRAVPDPDRAQSWSFVHPTFGEVAHVSIESYVSEGEKRYAIKGFSMFPPRAKPGAKGTGLPSPAKPTVKPKPAAGSATTGSRKTTGAASTPGKSARAPSPTGATTKPKQGAKEGAQAQAPSQTPDEKLAALKALPDNIKAALGGESSFTIVNVDQLRRIAQKLKQLSLEDLQLYKLVANRLSKNLDDLEASIDFFIQFKEKIKAQAQEAAKRKEPTLQEQLGKTWEKFDEKKFATLDATKKEQLARELAEKQRDIQLKHMVTHPGETAVGMVEGVVRVDKLAKSIAEDVKEAADGNANGYARLGAAVGAVGKFVAGVAAILFVILLFVPGVNLAELALAGLLVGIATISLATIESELRIKAAAEAKTPEEFKKETEKAAAAQVTAISTAALIGLTFVAKIVARIPLPGRLQNVGNALKIARTTLAQKTGVSQGWQAVRTTLLEKLRASKQGLPEALAEQTKSVAQSAKLIEGMSGDEFINRLAAGDEALKDLGIPPEQARAIQQLAKTPEGKNLPERLRQDLLQGLKDAPGEASKKVDRFLGDADKAIKDLEKAQSPDQLQTAIDAAEKKFGPGEQAKRALADEQSYVQKRVTQRLSFQELEEVARKQKYTEFGKRAAQYLFDIRGKLKVKLRSLRESIGAKGYQKGGTVAVGESDVPGLEGKVYEGRSPQAGGEKGTKYAPDNPHPRAQGHAEENLLASFSQDLEGLLKAGKITRAELKGRNILITVEEPPCPTCVSGAANPNVQMFGSIAKFMKDFPEIRIEITDVRSEKVVVFQGSAP